MEIISAKDAIFLVLVGLRKSRTILLAYFPGGLTSGVRCVLIYTSAVRQNLKSVSSREIMKILKAKGWEEVAVRGSHHQLKHRSFSGRITIPHPKKDLPWPTVKSILKQAGLSESDL